MANTALAPDLVEAIEALAENLLASEPFAAFDQAYARFSADSKASGLMRDLTQSQTSLRARQSDGSLSQADIAQFRILQAEVQDNQLVTGYIQAQNDAIAYLQQINQEISQWLGVDFATLARRPSSCCG